MKGRGITETAERFWTKFERAESGCWIWTASNGGNGYGKFNRTGAHRASYELLVGPIPEGLDLDHLCRNRGCVNPAHLEPVTRAENARRGAHGDLITHCPSGHPKTPENTFYVGGYKRCRPCADVWNERRRLARSG